MKHSHGISIGVERIGEQIFLAGKAHGKLSHGDYEVITPFLESALTEVKSHQVLMYFDVTEFDGWELRAAWDDFRIGLKHCNAFHRIAIVGSNSTQDWLAKIGNWFTSSEVRYFDQQTPALD